MSAALDCKAYLNQGRIQGKVIGVTAPPKTYRSNFFHHNFVQNSENNIRDIRPFFRQLFCHTSAVKYTSSLLAQRSRYETWLPNITEIAPLKLTGWIHPWLEHRLPKPLRCIRDVRVLVCYPLIGSSGIKWCLHRYSCVLLIIIPPVTDVHVMLKKIKCEGRVWSTKRSQGRTGRHLYLSIK